MYQKKKKGRSWNTGWSKVLSLTPGPYIWADLELAELLIYWQKIKVERSLAEF